MLDAKALIRQAHTLRAQGKLDEALLAASSAVEADGEDANAWWQLFLAQEALDDDDDAKLEAVSKVVHLAPDFAGGWRERGVLCYLSDDLEEAVSLLENALALQPDNVRALQYLERSLNEQNDDSLNPRRIQVLQTLCDLGSATSDEMFALGYLYGEQNDAAAAASVYEKLDDLLENSTALKNLSIMYTKLGRGADATDALRLCKQVNPSEQSIARMLELRTEARSVLRESLRKLPDPYLPQQDWYRHYVSPFALLQMEPSEVKDNIKAVQRARQAVLRELELEENTVSWMPGLHIDRSSALALFEELNDVDLFAAHQRAHEDPAFQAFLSTGSLKHFTTDKPDIDDVRLQCTVDRNEVAPLSLKFAAQFDDVLTRAIERNDLAAVQALLSGRRWVLPEHAERCLEGALRALVRLSEPLDAMHEAARKGPVRLPDILAWLQTSPLAKVLPLLTIDFHTVHERFYLNMRGLSIAHYGRASDPAEALELLNRAQVSAEMSATTLQQFRTDRAMLEEEVAKEAKHNVRLTFGKNTFSMDKTAVTFGSQTIRTVDVHSFRWGMTHVGGSPDAWKLSIAFGNGKGTEISLSWNTTPATLEAQRAHWFSIIEASMAYVIEHALVHFKNKLRNSNGVPMGDVVVFESGVRFSVQGFIFKKDHFAPWAALKTHMANGDVVIKDVTNPKVFARLPIATVDNALLLRTLAHHKES